MTSCGVGRAELVGSPSPIGRSRPTQRRFSVRGNARWGRAVRRTITDVKQHPAATPLLAVAPVDLGPRVLVSDLVRG